MAKRSHPVDRFATFRFVFLLGAAAISLLSHQTARAQPPVTSADIPFAALTPSGVNTATGEYCVQYRETDIAVPGPTTLGFGRYYASYLEAAGVPPSALGTNWRGTFDWRLVLLSSEARVFDPRGRTVRFEQIPTGWRLLEPAYMPFQLVPDGSDFLFLDAPSQRVYRFDAAGALTRIEDQRGPIFTLTYGTGAGPLSHVEDGLGRALDFSYDTNGHMTSVTDGVRTVQYAYTGDLLTSFEDAAGRMTTYAYAAPAALPGLLQSITEPMGNTYTTQMYDATGRVAQNIDANGYVETFTYFPPSPNSQATEWTDRDVQAWTLTHELGHALGATHRVTSVLDPTGGTWSFGYDNSGRPAGFSRPSGATIFVTNDPGSGRPSEIRRPDGSLALRLTWTATTGQVIFHFLTGREFPDGTTETFTYDSGGNVLQMVDRGGFVWDWTYTSRGMPFTYTNPAGGITNLTYNSALDVTGFSNGMIVISSIVYDEHHRVTSYQWADGSTRAFTYDDRNLPTGFRNEALAWNFHVWNDNGLLASSTDGLGHTTQYQYDLMDRLIAVQGPLFLALSIGRDELGRRQTVSDGSGRTVSYAYDGLSRLVGITDPAGNQTQLLYDSDGRLLSATDPLAHTVTWEWDALDRVTLATNALGAQEQYLYDAMDRLTSALGPVSFNRTFAYDARDLLTLYQVATLGIGLARHALGGITEYTDPDGKIWTAARDANGRVTSQTDPLGRTMTYEYDARGRLFRITRVSIEEERIFDFMGRVTAINHTGGPALTFTYDAANRLTGATGVSLGYDDADRIVSSNGLTFTRDPDGRILTETYAPGKTVTYTYDARGLLESVSDWIGGSTTFAYDAAGRLTGLTRPNGTTATYQYDAAGRLTQKVEAQPGPTQTPLSSLALTRDALGRVIGADRRAPLMPGVTETGSTGWSYDDASQNIAFTYDVIGRVTNDGVRTYVWDGASRLTSYTEGSFTESFTYDAFGRMLTRSVGASTTHDWVWNYVRGEATIDVDRRNPMNPDDALYFVRTPSGALLHSIDGLTGARRYFHSDESGHMAYITTEGGSVVTSYAYTPLGEKTAIGQTAGNSFTFHAWQGFMELASPTGGLYLWAPRGLPYDARTGLGVVATINRTETSYDLRGRPAPVELMHYSRGAASAVSPPPADEPWKIAEPLPPWEPQGPEMRRQYLHPDLGGGLPSPGLGPPRSDFLAPVEGLKVGQEVVDYPGGGFRTTPYRLVVDTNPLGIPQADIAQFLNPAGLDYTPGMVLGVDRSLDPFDIGQGPENINISRPVSGTFRVNLFCACREPGWKGPGPVQTPGWKLPGPITADWVVPYIADKHTPKIWSVQSLPLIGSISEIVTLVPPGAQAGPLTIEDQWGRRSNRWPLAIR